MTLQQMAQRQGCTSLSALHEEYLAPHCQESLRMLCLGFWDHSLACTLGEYLPKAQLWFFHKDNAALGEFVWPPRTGYTPVLPYSPAAIADFFDKDDTNPTLILDRSQTMATFEMWWPHVAPGGVYLAEGQWSLFNREYWAEFGIRKAVLHSEMMAIFKPGSDV